MRTDLSTPQQIVQACHAALEAGLAVNHQYTESPSIVLIQIPDKSSLEQELEYLRCIGIECASFYEPYQDTGLTAFATVPVTEDKRQIFKKYQLWGRPYKKSKSLLVT